MSIKGSPLRKTILVVALGMFVCKSYGQELIDVSLTHIPEILRTPLNSMDASVADIDQDGDLDIVVAIEFHKNVILLNDGNGQFTNGSDRIPDKIAKETSKPYRYYPYHDSEDVMIVDIDKDGLLDLLFVTEDDKTNELYFQQEDGSFIDSSDQFPVDNVSNALIKGDFDDDGWIDFIVGNNGQNNYLRNHEGRLIDETTKRLPVISDITQDVETGDYDNDGDLDLLVGNEDDNRLLQNDGNGFFKDITAEVFSDGISEETREADFADVDGDGDLDIYFANVRMFTPKEAIQRLLINEHGKFVERSENIVDLNPIIGALEGDFYDIDNDGDPDLIVGKLDGLTIGINDGTGNFKENTLTFITPMTVTIVDIEIADFNGDSKPDIFVACFRGPDKLLLSQSE